VACLLALLSGEPIAGQASEAPEHARNWRLSAAAGVTGFDREVDAPGDLVLLGVERKLGSRLACGADLGFGSTARRGQCPAQTKCPVAEYWATYEAGADFRLFRLGEASTGIATHVGAAGPDAEQFYDVGIFVLY